MQPHQEPHCTMFFLTGSLPSCAAQLAEDDLQHLVSHLMILGSQVYTTPVLNILFLVMCVDMCTWVQCPQSPEEGTGLPWSWSGCQTLEMDARNWTQVLRKSSIHSQPLEDFSDLTPPTPPPVSFYMRGWGSNPALCACEVSTLQMSYYKSQHRMWRCLTLANTRNQQATQGRHTKNSSDQLNWSKPRYFKPRYQTSVPSHTR